MVITIEAITVNLCGLKKILKGCPMAKKSGVYFLEKIVEEQAKRKKDKDKSREEYISRKRRLEAFCRLTPDEQDEIVDYVKRVYEEVEICEYCGEEYSVIFRNRKKFRLCKRCVDTRNSNRVAFNATSSYQELEALRGEVDIFYKSISDWSREKLTRQLELRTKLGLKRGLEKIMNEIEKRERSSVKHFEFDF